MGTTKPEIREVDQPPKPKGSLQLLLLFGLLALLVSVPVGDSKKEAPAPTLQPNEQQKLEKRLRELDDSEQYVLLAEVDGWYACLHSGRRLCYLKSGEVWKYGVTSKGKFGRYSLSFLTKNNVSYVVQFQGNYSECLKQEQIRLFNYPYLPENLARLASDRLPRPPCNPIMR